MVFLEKLNSVLSGVALPVVLIAVGLYLAVRLRLFYVFHPVRFIRDLKDAAKGEGTSPFKALSIALAGTLGVGNISGVAAAITAGGAGAVFWMWISALAAMSVKYAEVALAVKYRRVRKIGCEDENGTAFKGGRKGEKLGKGDKLGKGEKNGKNERLGNGEECEKFRKGERCGKDGKNERGEKFGKDGKFGEGRKDESGKKGETEYYGGAMYYIRDGLSGHVGKKAGACIAALFAFLLVTNSVVTGNIVQVNAAASVWENTPRILWGAAIGVVVLAVVAGGVKRIGDFTVLVIPFLSLVYIILSMYIILSNASVVPIVFEEIFRGAFSVRAAGGGVLGYGVTRAVRFGVTRGIFSNEAGCGTAPTSHASANTKSPHHQGCFGIFEVFCDTMVLCTMTAVVILMADVRGLDGIPLSVASYGVFGGDAARWIIGVSVVIFALATVICQEYYGIEALSYFTPSPILRRLYIALSFAATLIGSVMSASLMWQIADFVIAAMTVINILVVFILSDEVVKEKRTQGVALDPPRTFLKKRFLELQKLLRSVLCSHSPTGKF